MKRMVWFFGWLVCGGMMSLGSLSAQDSVEVRLKVFPPEARLSLSGLPIRPVAVDDTVRTYRLPAGRVALSLTADGYIPKTLRFTAQAGLGVIAEKLDPKAGPLVPVGEVTTGPQPRSVIFTPDSRAVIVPLVGGAGAEVWSIPELTKKTLLTPPTGADQAGFTDAAVLTIAGEIWLTQQGTSNIHIFRLDNYNYKGALATDQSGTRLLQFTPDGSLALIANWDADSITILPTANRTAQKDLYVGGSPRGLALADDRQSLFVNLFEGGQVTKLSLADPTNFQKTGRLSFDPGSALRPAAASPSKLFFGDMASGRLLTVAWPSEELVGQTYLGPNPTALVVTPDHRTLFATTRGRNNPADYTLPGPDYGQVLVIDTATSQVIAQLWGRHQPTGLAVSPDGKWLAFTDYLDNRLEVYRIK